MYDGSCPSLETIKRWATEFKRGRKSLEDGRPSSATTKKNTKILDMIMNDRRVAIDRTVIQLGVCAYHMMYYND